MASIHRDPHGRSPFWYCAYRKGDGTRSFKSTKQTDRKKALAFCLRLEAAADKARAGELTEVAARECLNDILASTGARALPAETARAFAERWLESKQQDVRAHTFRRYRQVTKAFLAGLGPLADRSLSCITRTHIVVYRDQRRALSRVTRGTLGRDMATLSGMFISARRQGLILINPVEGIQLPASEPLEREVFTPEEIGALLAISSLEWRTLILLGAYVGARLSDAVGLGWDQVDLSKEVITFRQGKTSHRVQIPIHQQLSEHLWSIAGDQTGLLCPTLVKANSNGRGGLSNQFAALMRQAGIDAHKVKAGRNSVSRKSFHSLRHTFISALANANIGPEMRMKLSGHRSLSVHQLYSHIELEPLRNAIKTLPAL